MDEMEIFRKPISFGNYQLFAKVDQGGMAEVFLAVSPKKELHGQFLAIKKLLPHLNSNKAFVNLLIHEAKIGVLLQHPGIAQVIDLGSHKNEFFIAMEFVHGKSLGRVLEKIRDGQAPPLSLETSSYIILQILKALTFAHDLKDRQGRDLNIIHRDLSPGNILLEYTGQVKLGDFGIATAENRLKPNFSSAALGKLVYMPPEQAVNDPAIRASDLYSLGVVYYELLAGVLPFESSSPTDAYRKILDGRQSNIEIKRDDIPKEVQSIIQKLLEKSPKKRYQTAPELFDALVTALKNHCRFDFRNASTKDFLRKKLAEYMRKSFETEIISELQVVQEALRQQIESSDLKETSPIQIPAGIASANNDVTGVEFQDDDAITRHFPLTDQERGAIVRGVSADHAIERIADRESSDQAFELISITSYNDGFSSKIFKHLPIEKRLESLHLPRDEKETLKQSIPVLKITDQNQLDDFENQALPREVNPAPLSPPSGKSRLSEKKSKEPGPRKKSISTKILALVIIGIGIGLAALFYRVDFFYPPKSSSAPALLPTQQISLILTGDADLEIQKNLYNELSNPSRSFAATMIENFFNREFNKHQSSMKPVMKLIVHPPQPLNRSLDIPAAPSDTQKVKIILDFLKSQGVRFQMANDATLILYLLATNESQMKLSDDTGSVDKKVAILFIDTNRETSIMTLRKIAAELARIYGATKKIDSSGATKVPEGLASPNQSPLFPQTKADLMGGDVPLSLIENRPIQSFDDIVIGRQTAEELGWMK